MQESSIRRCRELHQKLMSTGDSLRYGFTATTKFQNNRISGSVTVVDDNVILNVIAVAPDFQLSRAGRPVQCRLAPDGNQLPLRLSDNNKSVFSRWYFMLTHGIVAGEISGVDARKIGRLEAAALSITVAEYAGTIGARY